MDKRIKKRRHRDTMSAVLFLSPCMIGFLIFVALPVLVSFFFAFTKWHLLKGLGSMEFVGFANFIKLLSGKDLWFNSAFQNTFLYAVVTVPVGIGLGLVVATLIHRYVYGSAIFRFVIFIPYISSVVASIIVWKVIFQPSYGPINAMLSALGVKNLPGYFTDPKTALWMIIIFSIWQVLGYNVIVFYAGLKGIPSELYEAASIDGASEVQKFFNITLPMISPTTFFLSTLGLISAFKVFDIVQVATGGGPGRSTNVLALYIYTEVFENYQMGTSSAAVWLMFIIVFVVTMIQNYGQRKFTVE